MSKTETQSEAPINKLREAFEFDLIDNHAYTAPDLEKRGGYYADDEIQFAWEMAVVAWEAAHASTSSELRRLDAENKALRARLEASGAVPVVLGKKLFQFNCHQDWVNRAQRAWKMAGVRSEDTICLDQKGRVLRKGLEFARADKEGAFPVVVYLALVDDTAAHDAWLAAKTGDAA